MTFESTINKWVKVLDSDTLFHRAVVENRAELIDLNTAQLEKGKDALGNFLDEYISDSYAQFKIFLGSEAPFGIPNLKLEGDFYSGWVLEYDGRDFVFDSTDEKAFHLSEKYGIDIFGISEDDLDKIVRPMFLESILIMIRNGVL